MITITLRRVMKILWELPEHLTTLKGKKKVERERERGMTTIPPCGALVFIHLNQQLALLWAQAHHSTPIKVWNGLGSARYFRHSIFFIWCSVWPGQTQPQELSFVSNSRFKMYERASRCAFLAPMSKVSHREMDSIPAAAAEAQTRVHPSWSYVDLLPPPRSKAKLIGLCPLTGYWTWIMDKTPLNHYRVILGGSSSW